MNDIKIPIAKIIQDKGRRYALLRRLRAYDSIGEIFLVEQRAYSGRRVMTKMRAYSINEINDVISKIQSKYDKTKRQAYMEAIGNLSELVLLMKRYKGLV